MKLTIYRLMYRLTNNRKWIIRYIDEMDKQIREACDRYERQSHVTNRLKVQEPSKYIDIRGIERYVR